MRRCQSISESWAKDRSACWMQSQQITASVFAFAGGSGWRQSFSGGSNDRRHIVHSADSMAGAACSIARASASRLMTDPRCPSIMGICSSQSTPMKSQAIITLLSVVLRCIAAKTTRLKLSWVITGHAPWMASSDPLDAAPGATPRAIFGNRIQHVLAAGGVVSALPSAEPAEYTTVAPYSCSDQCGGNPFCHFKKLFHPVCHRIRRPCWCPG